MAAVFSAAAMVRQPYKPIKLVQHSDTLHRHTFVGVDADHVHTRVELGHVQDVMAWMVTLPFVGFGKRFTSVLFSPMPVTPTTT